MTRITTAVRGVTPSLRPLDLASLTCCKPVAIQDRLSGDLGVVIRASDEFLLFWPNTVQWLSMSSQDFAAENYVIPDRDHDGVTIEIKDI